MALILPRRKAGALDISELFSTSLYTGNNTARSITNGIDLSGEGGLVWIKCRSLGQAHALFDTNRGALGLISSNLKNAESNFAGTVTAFNSDGFTLGSDPSTGYVNAIPQTYASWTFRKSPSFFDVVTYTGDRTAGRTISHNLGVTPGMIVVKNLDSAENWAVYHRSASSTRGLILNSTITQISSAYWNDTEPTDSVFTVGVGSSVNASANFIAYIFAHDPSDNGVIQCGSYTGNGSTTGPTVTLGWEPQWVMIRRIDSGGAWFIYDNVRSTSNPRVHVILANSASAEDTINRNLDFTSTGFQPKTTFADVNASGGTYTYTAIRKEGV